jgi:outer membrane protein TolC
MNLPRWQPPGGISAHAPPGASLPTSRHRKGWPARAARDLGWLVGAALLFGMAGSEARARDLAFPDAVTLLRGRNESLQAADAEIDRARDEKNAARGLLLPKVEAGARFTRIDDPIALALGLDLNGIRDVIIGLHPGVPPQAIPSFSKQVDYRIQDDRFWRASVSASWPIFTGGRILAANRAAGAQLDAARAQRRRTEASLWSDLVRRYFGVQLARQVEEVRRQVLEGLDRHLYEAKRFEDEGIIARVERLQAEVAHAQAQRELQKAHRDREVAETALAGILSVDETVTPTSPLFVSAAIPPVDSFRVEAARDNDDLAWLAAQRRLASQGLAAQRGSWLPEVYLFGVKELYTDDLTVLDPKWATGVGARYALFDGFSRWNRTQAARSVVRRVDLLEARARRDIGILVEKQHSELDKAREQFTALDSTLALADENLRARTRAFEEGLSTSTEVVDARLALAGVKLERLLAAYDFDVALAELLEASGQSPRFETFRASAETEVNP